jgi:hypothetical protein
MLTPPELTFTRLAQLCLALDDVPSGEADLATVDGALVLDSWSRDVVLDEAVRLGYVNRPRPEIATLADRGRRLAAALREGFDVAKEKSAAYTPRSFTTYMPRGDEDLGGGRP